jgi:hypothetical protein
MQPILTTFLLLCLVAALAGCARRDEPSAPQPDGEAAAWGGMESYKWQSRPLLLFAPAGNEAHLRAMRADLAEQAAGAADRDIVLIEVVPGQSRAGDTPLSQDQAAQLRRRYRVRTDAFAVVLVGKDGMVKLQEDRPVPVGSLFELIDQMPMRRREMRDS